MMQHIVSWKVDVARSSETLVNVKSKGKVVSIHFLTEHHAMKAYWGVEV
jgi:hypothetical protein